MICEVLHKGTSSHREEGAQGASAEIQPQCSQGTCTALPQHTAVHIQVAGTAQSSMVPILCLGNRKCLLTKPVQIRNAKATHHGNVEFVDMLEETKHTDMVSGAPAPLHLMQQTLCGAAPLPLSGAVAL